MNLLFLYPPLVLLVYRLSLRVLRPLLHEIGVQLALCFLWQLLLPIPQLLFGVGLPHRRIPHDLHDVLEAGCSDITDVLLGEGVP